MRSFDFLVSEAVDADVSGWGWGWLEGRAHEERPPWGFAKQLSARLRRVDSALDIDTGGGEVISRAPSLPSTMVVTEGWWPNAQHAQHLLAPRGVHVLHNLLGEPLPLADRVFELVTSRHPVAPDWHEIYRVLQPGGSYFAQHVGPASAFELIEHFLGPLPAQRQARDARAEISAARSAGLQLTQVQTASCRMEFYDVGAVVWILRRCVWWVPDFTVDRYAAELAELDAGMREGRPFIAYSRRHLLDLIRPVSEQVQQR
ncbi:class I SAM-dependent methyltransferase [Ornithinimicrobium sp. Arc0846-15]|nr:class I SAM-dependent methyltransferase [Ornithinimicrobium laminariae]